MRPTLWTSIACTLLLGCTLTGAARAEKTQMSDAEQKAYQRMKQYLMRHYQAANGHGPADSLEDQAPGKFVDPPEGDSTTETVDGYAYTLRGLEFWCGDHISDNVCKPGKSRMCLVHGEKGTFWAWEAEAHPSEYGKTGRLSFYIDSYGQVIRAEDLGGQPGTYKMPEVELGTIEDYEAKATRALRTISAGQTDYNMASDPHSFAPSLAALRTGVAGQPYTSERIASGRVYGYTITMGVGSTFICPGHYNEKGEPQTASTCEPDAAGVCKLHAKPGSFFGWNAEAHPVEYGKTGRRSFYIDETGLIRGEDIGGKPGHKGMPEL